MRVEIFTDGSARGNPGAGGYGVVMKAGTHYKELSAGYRKTTNNRMELLAVIKALEEMKKEGLHLIITTDSKYVCESVQKGWVFRWRMTGFKGKKNADLWRQFLTLYPKFKIEFRWVKGHAGHLENERCDQLATLAADQPDKHLIDEGYESGLGNQNLML
ncbi:MAG: ribonuclease HI [Bacteroidia bacterium]|jgi:ribonuclease HI|nr:ribonuclease HI [Bacteroidia bacterium]